MFQLQQIKVFSLKSKKLCSSCPYGLSFSIWSVIRKEVLKQWRESDSRLCNNENFEIGVWELADQERIPPPQTLKMKRSMLNTSHRHHHHNSFGSGPFGPCPAEQSLMGLDDMSADCVLSDLKEYHSLALVCLSWLSEAQQANYPDF